MKKAIITLVVFLSGITVLYAQQDAEYSMYMFNGLYINPAYAGSHDVISATALYRHQWAGISGAPRSGSFSIHSPFRRDQYALGGILTFDRVGKPGENNGVVETYNMYGDFAYRLRFKKGIKLSLGIQAGGMYYKSMLNNNTVDKNDAAFLTSTSKFLPNVGFGVYVYGKKFYAGVSVPHILNLGLAGDKIYNAVDRGTVSRMWNHYIFTAGYMTGKDGTKVRFKPSTLVKVVAHAPVSWDITASALFVNRVWLGATYRLGLMADSKDANGKLVKGNVKGNRLVLLSEFKITPQFRVGYAYDIELDNLKAHNGGSYEIMLGYDFGFDKSKFVTPRYVTYF
jgi:type IX secretion system PorP/SprF family membrane protein